MRVVIEQTAGKDYPANLKGNPTFTDRQKAEIRKRLELRPQDEIEIKEVES